MWDAKRGVAGGTTRKTQSLQRGAKANLRRQQTESLGNQCAWDGNSWCPGPDSNRHALRRGILSPLRLPVSPPGQVSAYEIRRAVRARLWGNSLQLTRSRAPNPHRTPHRTHSGPEPSGAGLAPPPSAERPPARLCRVPVGRLFFLLFPLIHVNWAKTARAYRQRKDRSLAHSQATRASGAGLDAEYFGGKP